MDWVKLHSNYFLDVSIACGDDAAEVMFTRGIAYCGAAESGGFIPEVMLLALGRKSQAKTATSLVVSGKWERVQGGYQIVQWHKWQAELETLIRRRSKDVERKRAERKRGQSVDAGAETGADIPRPKNEKREEKKEQDLTTLPDGSAEPTINVRAQDLARDYCGLQPMSKFPAVMGICRTAINTQRYTDQQIHDALTRLAKEGRSLTVETLRIELEGMPAPRTPQKLSGIARALNLAERLASDIQEIAP